MNSNLFYFHTLNSIGGVETFFYQLAKKYGKKFDITIMYSNGNPEQIKRLSEYVRVKQYKDGERIKCKRCFVAFNAGILDNVDAEEYIQMLHGDYRSLGVIPDRHPKIQKYVAVSEVVREAYRDITGDDPVVSYNPFIPVKPKKVLRLVSATRLTPDKGMRRMEKLAQVLDDEKIPFVWDIYTDVIRPFKNPSISIHEPRLDIVDFIADADYFVQLSDAEGYCYSVVESLSVGTPVIITDFKVAHEIGVQDRVNGFILPMDMSQIPTREIYRGLKKFKYDPLPDKWDELLLPVPSDYEEQMKMPVKVECKKVYFDLEFNRMMSAGETWECKRKRAEVLMNLGVVNIIEE
mgnify:CR=1 FL=1